MPKLGDTQYHTNFSCFMEVLLGIDDRSQNHQYSLIRRSPSGVWGWFSDGHGLRKIRNDVAKLVKEDPDQHFLIFDRFRHRYYRVKITRIHNKQDNIITVTV